MGWLATEQSWASASLSRDVAKMFNEFPTNLAKLKGSISAFCSRSMFNEFKKLFMYMLAFLFIYMFIFMFCSCKKLYMFVYMAADKLSNIPCTVHVRLYIYMFLYLFMNMLMCKVHVIDCVQHIYERWGRMEVQIHISSLFADLHSFSSLFYHFSSFLLFFFFPSSRHGV